MGDLSLAHKDAVQGGAFEVPMVVHGPVIFASVLVEDNANPLSRGKRSCSRKLYGPLQRLFY